MKPVFLVIFLITLMLAIGSGWFFDKQTLSTLQDPLEIPDNIDYYLAEVKLTAFDESGEPSYLLSSPYLEHFVREDISVIQQPDLQYFSEKENWTMSAQTGHLQHQSEIFKLQQQVSIRNIRSNDLINLTTELMIFNPNQELAKLPQPLRLVSNNLDLQASSALLDIKKGHHIFNRVKATYDDKKSHEPS